ncbi:MAG TPA: PAS domain S-box protein [Chloroflexia bacterium]|nr:PAS domain S-box protein [Chloroflexia bacterium]
MRADTQAPPGRGYAIAVVATGAAVLLSLVFRPFIEQNAFLLFFAAVAVSAWYGRARAALLSVALGGLASNYFFLPPFNSLKLADPITAARLGGFVAVALVITALSEGRARAATRLYAERERFRITLASLADAVIVTDAAGTVTFLNPAAEQITGWTHAQALGRNLATVFRTVSEETGQSTENPASRVLSQGVAAGQTLHSLLIDQQGGHHPVEHSEAPIRDVDGALVGVVLVFRDVTARRNAENALRASEARFRTLADTAPVLIWMAGPDGGRTYFNQRWFEFTGRTLEQEQGNGWAAGLHTADRARFMYEFAAALSSRRSLRLEYRLRRADGIYRWLLMEAQPLASSTGAFTGYIGTCVDIQERKQAEEAEAFLTEASERLAGSLDYAATLATVTRLLVPARGDLLIIDLFDAAGSLQRVAVAGATPEQQGLLDEIQQHYQVDADRTSIRQVVDSGESVLLPVIPATRLDAVAHDARHRQIMAALAPRSLMIVPFVARGHTVGTLTVSLTRPDASYGPADVALLEEFARRAAVALDNARLYQEAQEAIQVRDRFLSIASHELRTPLTSILAAAQLVQRRTQREGALADRDRRGLQLIINQSQRLNRMIDGLLDLSRIQSGQLSIEPAPVDLAALVRRSCDEQQATLTDHTVELESGPAPLMIQGDALRLEQVLQNLLQNAVKYSPAGSPVQVRVYTAGEEACVAVSDQGMGIPAAAQPHIFQRFYRAPNAVSGQISGLGIGLYVAQQIATLHGGTITVESHEGAGSTFTLRLPCAGPVPQAPQAEPQQPVAEVGSGGRATRG